MIPKIKTAVYTADLPLSGKIEYRPILMKEEMAIFTAMQFGNEDDLFSTLKNIVKDCIITPNFDMNNLSLYEFFYLIMLFRTKSKGELVDLSAVCENEKCGAKIDFSINILNSTIFKNKDKPRIMVPVDENLGIELNSYPIEALEYIDQIAKDKSNITAIYNLIASCINKIMYEGKVYNAKESTKEEIIENVLSRISDEKFHKLYTSVDKLFSLSVIYEYECPKCGTKAKIESGDILSFLF